MTRTQLDKLASFHTRVLKVVYDKNASVSTLPSILNLKKKRACEIVRSCLDGDVCDQMKSKFVLFNHQQTTRNNKFSLKLPVIKTEYGRRAFVYMAAKFYNELPIDYRRAEGKQVFLSAMRIFLHGQKPL